MITEDHPLVQAIVRVRETRLAEDLRSISPDHEKNRMRSIRFEAADAAIVECARAVMATLREGREPEIPAEVVLYAIDAVAVVTATEIERDHARSIYPHLSWDDEATFHVQVGSIEGRPIHVTLHASKILGQRVLFVDPCGDAVDWKQVRSWISRLAPNARQITSVTNLPSAL